MKLDQDAQMARLTHSVDYYGKRLGLQLQNAGTEQTACPCLARLPTTAADSFGCSR